MLGTVKFNLFSDFYKDLVVIHQRKGVAFGGSMCLSMGNVIVFILFQHTNENNDTQQAQYVS